jgi:lipoprotein Spr
MIIGREAIPEHFWRVEFDQNHDRDSPSLPDILESPNCQNFAYALLRHFGCEISPFRSSSLWEDTEETVVVNGEPKALDLLLFNWTSNPWGAHVALCLGDGEAIHLSKRESTAVIWPISKFLTLPEYRILIGAKRPRKLAGPKLGQS